MGQDGSRVTQAAHKFATYADLEAVPRHIWYLDPRASQLEVFELRDGKWLLVGTFHDDAQVAAPPFAELTFDLSLLWPFDKTNKT